MSYTLPTYLRMHRRKAGLTQAELAYLIGCPDDAVSRLERGYRRPNLRTALACELVFRTSLRELFPGMYEEVEITVIERTHGLHRVLQGKPDCPRLHRSRQTVRELKGAFRQATAPDV